MHWSKGLTASSATDRYCSLSTQHVTREIRRQKRLLQEAASNKAASGSKDRPETPINALPSPPVTSESSVSPAPSTPPPKPPSKRAKPTVANGRVGKSSKAKKQSLPSTTSKSTISAAVVARSPPQSPSRSALSISELLSSDDDIAAERIALTQLARRRDRPAQYDDAQAVTIVPNRYLPSPLSPISSSRVNTLGGLNVTDPAEAPLLDYWLTMAPQMLHLDILPPSQQGQKPTHELFLPTAARATEAFEHIIMLPAALMWAKTAGDNLYVSNMVRLHRSRCVQYLNSAISRLVDQKVMEDYTHLGLMSLIWAENMYGDAQQAKAYGLVFREMVQLRLRQKVTPPRRDATVIAHWFNALTTVDFWPKGDMSDQEMVDAENLLKPLFPFLEAARRLAHQHRHTAAAPSDRHKYLSPHSPLTMILLSSRPYDTTMDASDDGHHRFLHLLLFRVLLFIHVGLLDTAQVAGVGMIGQYHEHLSTVIREKDVLFSRSSLALLLWTILNDPLLSSVSRHKDIAIMIYPVRRLGSDWLARINRLLLTWLGLTKNGDPMSSTSVAELIRSDWEAEQLPNLLMGLVIGSRSPTPETSSPPASHNIQSSRPDGSQSPSSTSPR